MVVVVVMVRGGGISGGRGIEYKDPSMRNLNWFQFMLEPIGRG